MTPGNFSIPLRKAPESPRVLYPRRPHELFPAHGHCIKILQQKSAFSLANIPLPGQYSILPDLCPSSCTDRWEFHRDCFPPLQAGNAPPPPSGHSNRSVNIFSKINTNDQIPCFIHFPVPFLWQTFLSHTVPDADNASVLFQPHVFSKPSCRQKLIQKLIFAARNSFYLFMVTVRSTVSLTSPFLSIWK